MCLHLHIQVFLFFHMVQSFCHSPALIFAFLRFAPLSEYHIISYKLQYSLIQETQLFFYLKTCLLFRCVGNHKWLHVQKLISSVCLNGNHLTECRKFYIKISKQYAKISHFLMMKTKLNRKLKNKKAK